MTRSWLLVTLFACGTPPNPPVSTPAVAARCSLRTTTWRDQPTVLRLPDGRPFADVLEVREATVALDRAATATFRTRALTLTGGLADLQLHATVPFIVGSYVVPGPKLPLRFIAATGGKATFELRAQGKPLRGERPCTELGLADDATFDPRAAVAAKTIAHAYVHADRAVPLAVTVGGSPVAELRFVESPRAEVLERRAMQARVAIYSDSLNPAEAAMFVGWVPQAALHTQEHGFGGSWATGGDRSPSRARPVPGTKVVSCATAVQLEVELAHQRLTVGTIAADAVIELLPDDSVRIRDAGVDLIDGARWVVAKAALAGCVTRP